MKILFSAAAVAALSFSALYAASDSYQNNPNVQGGSNPANMNREMNLNAETRQQSYYQYDLNRDRNRLDQYQDTQKYAPYQYQQGEQDLKYDYDYNYGYDTSATSMYYGCYGE